MTATETRKPKMPDPRSPNALNYGQVPNVFMHTVNSIHYAHPTLIVCSKVDIDL